jgi:uncharacterized protein YkwD
MRLRMLGTLALLAVAACATDQVGSLEPGAGSPGPSRNTGSADGGATGAADGGTSPTGNPGMPPPPGSPDGGTPAPGTDASTPPGQDAGSPPPPAQDASTPPANGFDQFQNHNLDVINMYRATLSVAPLVLDKQLCTFALAGSQQLSMDHMPHQHFIDASNNGTLWTSGFTSNAAENQGDPNGWYQLSNDPTQNELMQIDDIQKAMFAEGPGAGDAHGHYTNMMNPQLKRLGVGLLEINSQLYLTNDFSD